MLAILIIFKTCFDYVIPANAVCDPVIEEHFRRSLGNNYKEAEPVSNSVSITGSVDDHFAKALGDAWFQIKAKGGGHEIPDSEPWARLITLHSLPYSLHMQLFFHCQASKSFSQEQWKDSLALTYTVHLWTLRLALY